MFNKYKEIWFGALLGIAMWLLDAVMHANLGENIHSHGLWDEIFQPHPTALIFRLIYFVLATAFGVFLWRMNWRERQLRALEKAFIAFQRQFDVPALRLISNTRQLQNRNPIKLDETASALAEEINADAKLLDELAGKYLRFSEQVRNGQTAEALETLQTIERWLRSHNLTLKS